MKHALKVALLLVLATPIHATTYYVATTGNDSNNGTWSTAIGAVVGGGSYLPGHLEDVRTYNIALTGTQMSTLYANGPQH